MKGVDNALAFVGQFRVLWRKWDIRTLVVASFTFQLFLIVVAPFRRRSSRLGIRVSTWLSYLLADWVAAQAVGLITRATESLDAENELFALWAQFLLVHLGGPDTITALALEDNALWLRTGLHLGTLAYATLGILVRSARKTYSGLWVLMALMFLAGMFKYLERVMSLFHGRLMEIKEEPVIEHVSALMEDASSKEALSDVEMVRGAFYLFNSYKRLYADLEISRHARKGVRSYFLMRKPEEAYRMVEIQLNFMYEAMYTKASVIHRPAWIILRHIVVSIELAGLVMWCFFIEKRGYSDQDVQITRALVVGAAVVDLLALVRIYLSDWSIARLTKASKVRTRFYNRFLRARGRLRHHWFGRVFLARWSESMYRIDLECMDLGYIEKVIASLNLVHFGIRQFFVSRKRVPPETWNFIFEVLTKPCDDSTQYCLPNMEAPIDIDELIATALPLHVLEYQNILYPWFYTTCDQSLRVVNSADQVYRTISITIAEYLIYLFMQQPTMMFAAAGKEHVLGAYYNLQNCKNADAIFPNYSWEETGGRWKFGVLASELVTDSDKEEEDPTNHKMLMAINYLHYGQKWKEIARVWVELLCHAAITCRPNVHAIRLREGGQFLSFVWLLMVHLGIGPKAQHAPV